MPKVQKALPGLARFMGIETQGILRLDTVPTLQPVLEVEDYLGPNYWAVAHNNFAPAVVGNEVVITCPEHEHWRMKWASVKCIPTGVAVAVGLYLRKTINGTQYDFSLNPNQHQSSVVNAAVAGSWTGFGRYLNKLNLDTGDSMVARLDIMSIGAATADLDLWIQYQRVEV